MLFIAILATLLIIYIGQARLFSKKTFDSIDYKVKLSTEEAFEGEDIFIYEEITNEKTLPLPYAKVDTSLPQGLLFRITEYDHGKPTDKMQPHVVSVFVLKSREKVRRRWRVNCKTRGVYSVGGAVVVANDLFGMNPISKGFACEPRPENTVVVLPRPVDLDAHFTSSYYHSGDVITNHSLLSDPLLIEGTRDYTAHDPMNRINWKSTAAHGRLMVNRESYTRRHRFNIMLNMNSRDIERSETLPSDPASIELAITVCASILDRISAENVPVRIISNTPPEAVSEEMRADADGVGYDILFTPAYEGKRDMITALRVLAAIKTEMSCPVERMLDFVLEHKDVFAESGNLIVISAYISERMIVFHDEMRREGVNVIFYVTTSNRNAWVIPPDVEVYYKTHFD